MNKEKRAKNSKSFIADDQVHFHNHMKNPHMHSSICDRYVSGLDQNRKQRFYFTSNLTPIRVYVIYDEFEHEKPLHYEALNGRKFSPKSLRKNFKLKDSLIDVAKNLVFHSSSKSFIPPHLDRYNRRSHSASQTHLAQKINHETLDLYGLKSVHSDIFILDKKSKNETPNKLESKKEIKNSNLNKEQFGQQTTSVHVNQSLQLNKKSKHNSTLGDKDSIILTQKESQQFNFKSNDKSYLTSSFNRSNSY